MSLLEIAKDKINKGVKVSKSWDCDLETLWNKLFKRRKHEKDINPWDNPAEFTDDIPDKK